MVKTPRPPAVGGQCVIGWGGTLLTVSDQRPGGDRVKWPLIRLVALLIFGILLAACSSSRFGDIAPELAGGLPKDTPPRQGTPKNEAHKKLLDRSSKSDTEPQEAKKPNAQDLPDE